MASAEFAGGTYRTGFIPDRYPRPQIDLRTPEERERDEWIGERSERRIASVLGQLRINGIKIISDVVRYEKWSSLDHKGIDMRALFAEGSPIDGVDIQSKSSDTGKEAFFEEMQNEMNKRGITGITPMDWIAMRGLIVLNGSGKRIEIERDFKFQLYRVLQIQKAAA